MEREADARAERHPFWGVPETLAEGEDWLKIVHQRYRDIERDIAIGKLGPIRDNQGLILPAEAFPQWREERLFKKDRVLSRYLWLKDWVKSERERLGLPGKGARKPHATVDAMHAAARRFGALEGFFQLFRGWMTCEADDETEEEEHAWQDVITAYRHLEAESGHDD